MKIPTCMRPGCKQTMTALYSAPQYPDAWRGPLCSKHAKLLHERMAVLRDQLRRDMLECPNCKPRRYCPRHSKEMLKIGACPPEVMT